MDRSIRILLSSTLLLSLFACNEPKIEEQPIAAPNASPAAEFATQQEQQINGTESVEKNIEKKWDEARESTKKALQQSKEAGSDIWEASKESSKKMLSDGKVVSAEILHDVKEKSGIILEKSSEFLKKGNETLKGLIDEKSNNESSEAIDSADGNI